jgi:hypothetical protein
MKKPSSMNNIPREDTPEITQAQEDGAHLQECDSISYIAGSEISIFFDGKVSEGI